MSWDFLNISRDSITWQTRREFIQKLKAITARANTMDEMSVDAHIKLLRRYSSRAASALNSAGVSVNSTASESNSINAEG